MAFAAPSPLIHPVAQTSNQTTVKPPVRRLQPCQPCRRQPYRRHHAQASIPDPPKANTTDLTESCKSIFKTHKGLLSDKVDVTQVNHTTHRGLYINTTPKKNLLEGTELITLPETLLFTPKIAQKILVNKFPKANAFIDDLSDPATLALAILYELSEQSSPFAPTLSTLPSRDQIHAAVIWHKDELTYLTGSPVLARARRLQTDIASEYEQIQSAFQQIGYDMAPWCPSSDEYAYALAVVDSRCFPVSRAEPLVLAPIVHFCHGALETVGAPTAEAQFSGGIFGAKKLSVLTGKTLQHGDPITLALGGCACNADALLERGEVVADTAAHLFDVTFEVSALDPFFEDKIQILDRAGVDAKPTYYLPCADARGKWIAPEELEPFLRLLCLSKDDAFLLEAVFRRDVWSFMQMPVSADNEQAMCDAMIATCEEALDGYIDAPPSVEGDQFESRSAMRAYLAGALIQGEKDVLNAVKTHYERSAKSLDVLEYYAERRLKALDLLRPLDDSEIIDSESGAQVGRAFDENYR